ncbi:MAG: HEAT repeat domain-containing protein [Armatimonadota bacterium]|nr:HEAT repeat domain-containing protein [bacterium]MCS7309393.1 HEAT repeat domain-containing protein [Armatimonadota bacterium]MDW8290434.1 HEAT repeat domain-containing protein [Armatimonadota bacterium]
MQRTWLTVFALVLLALPSACQNLEQTIRKLQSTDENARRQAIAEIAPFGVQAIPALLALIENPNTEPGTLTAAQVALERVVLQSTRPGASAERLAAEKALLVRLQKPVPEHLRRLLLRLLAVVGTAQSVPTLQKMLSDRQWRELARMALERIPGKEATAALESAFAQTTEPAWKGALLMALGERKEPSSARLVLSALRSAQPEVRLTAIVVAGDFPTSDIQKALQQIALRGSAREKEAAQQSLARLAEQLRRAGATQRAASLFQWLYANGSTVALRSAGLAGLARTGDGSAANRLLQALSHPNPALASAAYALLQEMRVPGLAERLVVQMQETQGEQRLRLIDLMGYQSGAASVVLPALLKAFSEDNVEVKVAALQAMGRLRHADAAPALMAALRHGDGRVRQAAVEAVPGVALALQKQGKTEMATVLARTALEQARDRESILLLVSVLRSLGIEISARDFAQQQGMLVHWWILAPIAERNLLRERDLVDPAAPVNLQAEVNGVRWKRVELQDPQGILDFWMLAGARENTGGYAYAEVYSEAEQPVTLKIGSDDDVVCWVNGQKVHQFIGDRGLAIDQDTAMATLRQGWNRILCKVLNGADGWQLTVRLTTPDGKPLRLQQR